MGRPGSWSPGVGFCLRLLLLLSLALPTAGLLLWGRAENRRRMESLCGGWEAVLPRGQLVIARTGGHHTLTFYSPKGIRRGPERLRGGRCPHYGRGKSRTELWLSDLPADRTAAKEKVKLKTFNDHENEKCRKRRDRRHCRPS